MIHESAIIECETFEIGENCYIGPNVRITCREFIAGDYLWIPKDVEIGRGGCIGPRSKVHIGNSVGIFEGSVINPSEEVTIGNNVGIGADCLLWTHGAWLDPLQGFPYSFESVTIGDNVWLPARSIMLPGTKIGDNCVIGTGSVITKDIPSGSLAMGSPCKVIKENEYPKQLTLKEKDEILESIVRKWRFQLPHKGVLDVPTKVKDGQIIFNSTIIDCVQYKTIGRQCHISEDLRDFLRRHGIRIYNGKPFKSMKPRYESSIKSPSR